MTIVFPSFSANAIFPNDPIVGEQAASSYEKANERASARARFPSAFTVRALVFERDYRAEIFAVSNCSIISDR